MGKVGEVASGENGGPDDELSVGQLVEELEGEATFAVSVEEC